MRRVVSLLPFLCISTFALACRQSVTSSGAGGHASTTTTTGMGTATANASSSSGMTCTPGAEHTIQDITTSQAGNMTPVTLKGVVAMSQKFNVSHKTTCLWGVFVSAPGLSETAENTGLLVLSQGVAPSVPPGGTTAYCPELAMGQTLGDSIPDDVKPGDVLDIVGTTQSFPTTFNCMATDPQNSVPMWQLAQVCSVTRTMKGGPVPKAHVLTGADLASLVSTSDKAFHDKWGGVKVRVENATATIGMDATACGTSGTPPCVVQAYGNIIVDPMGSTTGIPFGDKIFYRGYQKTQVCHAGPTYMVPAMGMPPITFNFIEGFHYLDFCNWGLEVNDKCADVNPPSPDCASAMPPVTSCAAVP